MPVFLPTGFGWRRDLPDLRDYVLAHPAVQALLMDCPGDEHDSLSSVPPAADLREFFPPVDDQGALHASCAFATLGLVQYFSGRALGQLRVPSRLFLYQVATRTRRPLSDGGGELRSTFKALVRCGAPPESDWPYDPARFSEEPSNPFLFSFADEFRSIRYLRLDESGSTAAQTLTRVKAFVAAGFPSAFGFSVPSSIAASSDIPYRPQLDSVLGGQAAVVAGYDDARRIGSEKGALLVRSSWGTRWGESGYGWLPYAYVLSHLAADFWTLVRSDWLATGEFGRPRLLIDENSTGHVPQPEMSISLELP